MNTEILLPTEQAFRLAKTYIEAGEAVAFHTETVYGLGADARSDSAVRHIFELKGRPSDNPLIVHVHRDYDISTLIDGEPAYAAPLRRAFLPGPLTMVYPSAGKVSRFVSCGLDTLAIRVPASSAAQGFLRAVNAPIAAPSANLSKHVSPVTAKHVYEDFGGKIPLIIDGGACDGGIESTVLDCTGEIPVILRAGLISREQIAAVAGDCGVYRAKAGEKPKSPGMMYKHYAPRCRTAYFHREELQTAIALYHEEERAGGAPCILCEHALLGALQGCRALDLGDTDREMAQRLYVLLRRAETDATLLIGIAPTLRGGAMTGVLNRFQRAFGGTDEA